MAAEVHLFPPGASLPPLPPTTRQSNEACLPSIPAPTSPSVGASVSVPTAPSRMEFHPVCGPCSWLLQEGTLSCLSPSSRGEISRETVRLAIVPETVCCLEEEMVSFFCQVSRKTRFILYWFVVSLMILKLDGWSKKDGNKDLSSVLVSILESKSSYVTFYVKFSDIFHIISRKSDDSFVEQLK